MFKIKKESYAGVTIATNADQDFLNNHIRTLIYAADLNKIIGMIKELGLVESAFNLKQSAEKNLFLEESTEILFIDRENQGQILLNQSNKKNEGSLVCFNLNKDKLKVLEKFCFDGVKNRCTSHKCFGVQSGMGGTFINEKYKISPPSEINFTTDYGYGFEKTHDNIVNLLSNRNNQLLIFDGDPGTGKTSYIRYLVNKIDKKFIFTSSGLLAYLGEDLLIKFTDMAGPTILVIEDAEDVVANRAVNPLLPSLLNLIDGVQKENLPLSVILTWNAKNTEIDPALKRKGRLSYRHNFGPLPAKLANTKAKELGIKLNKEFKEPTTLAEIYNIFDEQGFEEDKKRMGF